MPDVCAFLDLSQMLMGAVAFLFCRVEAEKDVAVRTSILRASTASPTSGGPSLLCLPAVNSSPLANRISQARSPSLSPVQAAGGASVRRSLAVTDSGVQPRASAFGSFAGFRSSALSETLPDVYALAAQSCYTDKVPGLLSTSAAACIIVDGPPACTLPPVHNAPHVVCFNVPIHVCLRVCG